MSIILMRIIIYAMDIDTSYGKTNSYLDFNREKDRAILINLIKDADIFLDGYRYGALEQHGLGVDDVVKINKNIINLRMNAYGFGGPWARYFADSSNWRNPPPAPPPFRAVLWRRQSSSRPI